MSSSTPANDAAPSRRWACHFSGHVQGVGFRYTTQTIARRYPVTGYVRNLIDGRVELVMEGEERDLRAILEELKRQLQGYIERTDLQEHPALGEFAEFSIRH